MRRPHWNTTCPKRLSRSRLSRLLAVGIVILTGLGGGAWSLGAESRRATANWPAWRRDGSGISDEKGLPIVWSETQNVLWRTALPGEGNSSPIVWGNQVFLTAALEQGAKRLVLCYAADSGKPLWTRELLPGLKTTYYPKTGFASPTPATDGQRLYVFFDEPGLMALDMQGNVLWTRRLGPFNCVYNMASSPMLYEDMVIQCCDHHGPAFIAAFDRGSGKERWRTPRASSGFGHFGTPLLIPAPGGLQLVTNSEPVVSYDPDTGKELWSCRGMKECVGPSPAFGHGLVYASSGRTGPVIAIDPAGRGDITETHVHLHLTSGGPYVPTPLIYPHLMVPGDNGRMLFYNGAGQFVVEDRVRDHFSASPIGADGKIYWSSERGKTYVIDAARLSGEKPSVEVLAVNQLSGVCMGTPAIAGGRLFIRTSEALYCIGQTGKDVAAKPVQPLSGTLAELKERFEQHKADYQNEEEARIRLEIVEAIAKFDGPEVIDFLVYAAVKEPHWDVCEEAAKALGRKGLPAVDALIALLPDSRPFIRTIAVQELGRLKVTKAVPAILNATHDKQQLVRSASLQALAEIGQEATPLAPEIIVAMCSVLAEGEREEAVVRQSALEGLADLAAKVGDQRQTVIQLLVAVMHDRNPRLAQKAREILDNVYKATPAELEQVRNPRAGGPRPNGP